VGDRAESHEGCRSGEMDKVWRDLGVGRWSGCLLGLSISLSQPFYLSEPTIQLFIFFLLEDNICILVYIQNA